MDRHASSPHACCPDLPHMPGPAKLLPGWSAPPPIPVAVLVPCTDALYLPGSFLQSVTVSRPLPGSIPCQKPFPIVSPQKCSSSKRKHPSRACCCSVLTVSSTSKLGNKSPGGHSDLRQLVSIPVMHKPCVVQ